MSDAPGSPTVQARPPRRSPASNRRIERSRTDCLQVAGSSNAGGAGADDDDGLFDTPTVVTRHAFSFGRMTAKPYASLLCHRCGLLCRHRAILAGGCRPLIKQLSLIFLKRKRRTTGHCGPIAQQLDRSGKRVTLGFSASAPPRPAQAGAVPPTPCKGSSSGQFGWAIAAVPAAVEALYADPPSAAGWSTQPSFHPLAGPPPPLPA